MATRFKNIVTAAVGAIVLSTAFVAAAVGPAATAGQAPVAAYAAPSASASARA